MAIAYDLIAIPILILFGILTIVVKWIIDLVIDNPQYRFVLGLIWSIGIDLAGVMIRGKLYLPLRFIYGLYLSLTSGVASEFILGFNGLIGKFFSA